MMTGRSFSYRIIGEEHLKAHKCCQDAAGHEDTALASLIAVADGHGADEHPLSDIGAQLAVDISLAYMKQVTEQIEYYYREQIRDEHLQKSLMEQLKRSILARWLREVEAHSRSIAQMGYKSYGIRAYGTTLIAAAVAKNYWFAIQIGDGNCVELYGDLQFCESMPRDPYCRGAVTSSMCQRDALSVFRSHFSFRMPKLLLLHTDGIDDSLLEDAARHRIYDTLISSFRNGKEQGFAELHENLRHIAAGGKGDDTSLSGVFLTNDIHDIAESLYERQLRQRAQINRKQNEERLRELSEICEALQSDIASWEAQDNALLEEYQKLAQRASEINKERETLADMRQKTQTILAARQAEREKLLLQNERPTYRRNEDDLLC